MIIRKQAHPRAALIGNPSDGYFGRTIAFTFKNFAAIVTLFETPEFRIDPGERDHVCFDSPHAMIAQIRHLGYYGGVRLLQAAVKRFLDFCEEEHILLHKKNFTLRYDTDIPHHLGLAGSSAIITATFRTLMDFYTIEIPNPVLANLALEVETIELGIPAGLQDRVAQAYDTPTVMDFDKDHMEKNGYGMYTPLDPSLLPNLYIAYRTDLSEGSEVAHSNLRYRFEQGHPDVLDAIEFWKDLTLKAEQALKTGHPEKLGPLLDANFDKRRTVCSVSDGNIQMVETARKTGASAKFTGSGGAIIGTFENEAMFDRLQCELSKLNIEVLKPIL
ncbi:MAG: GHMP kinase [Lentisphaeria bacterium]|nr:GHMP kinase [Lentisphaeria bacterium]